MTTDATIRDEKLRRALAHIRPKAVCTGFAAHLRDREVEVTIKVDGTDATSYGLLDALAVAFEGVVGELQQAA